MDKHTRLRRTAAAVLLGLSPIAGHAAYPLQLGGSGADEVSHVVTSTTASGDVYVAGAFNQTITTSVNGATVTLTRTGTVNNYDIFVARIDPAGQVKWIASVGGGYDDAGEALAVDADGDVYLGGKFRGLATFGGVDLQADAPVATDPTEQDGFVAKFDGDNGSVLWARRFGSDGALGDERVGSLIPLPRQTGQLSGSVAVIGQAACDATFTGGTTALAGLRETGAGEPVCSGRDVFAARISGDGDWQWAYVPDAGTHSHVMQAAGGNPNGRAFVTRDNPPAGTQTPVFDEDFEDGGDVDLESDWGTQFSLTGTAWYRVRDYDYDFPNPSDDADTERFGHLADRSSATSTAFSTSGASRVCISLRVRAGAVISNNTFLERWADYPDGDDHYYIEWLNASGSWVIAHDGTGGRAAFGLDDYTGPNQLCLYESAAFHPNFRLRLRVDNGGDQEYNYNDSWFFDDVQVNILTPSAPPSPHLLAISSLNDQRPSFAPESQRFQLPPKLAVRQMQVSQAGALYVAGDVGPTAGAPWPDNNFCSGAQTAHRATVFKFNSNGAVCEWASSAVHTSDTLTEQVLLDQTFAGAGEAGTGIPGFSVAFPFYSRVRDRAPFGRVAQLHGDCCAVGPTATTQTGMDTSLATQVTVSYLAGAAPDSAWSDMPDPDDRLRVEYFGSDSAWHLLEDIPGFVPFPKASNFTLSQANARHASFRLRFRLLRGNSPAFQDPQFEDSYLFDDVRVSMMAPPRMESFARGLALAQDGVFLSGTFRHSLGWKDAPAQAAIQSHGFPAASTLDPFVAQLDASGRLVWLTGGRTADPDGLPDRIGAGAGAGGDGTEQGNAIAASASGSDLYVAGWHSGAGLTVGPDAFAGTRGGNDGHVFNMRADGLLYRNQKFVIGQPIVPPSGAVTNSAVLAPEFTVGGAPFDAITARVAMWVPPEGSDPEGRLIPLQPMNNIRIRWRTSSDLTSTARVDQVGSFTWPERACGAATPAPCFQLHVAGAPVDVNPADGTYLLGDNGVVLPTSGSNGGASDGGRFTAPDEGWSTLVYSNGPNATAAQPSYSIGVVRSLRYDHMPADADPGAGVDVRFQADVPAVIGARLTDPYHDETGRTGFVVNEKAYYDGEGDSAAYNRMQRTGAIVPVNEYVPGRDTAENRKLAVAWYRQGALGVYWPSKAVLYRAAWPTAAQGLRRIVIASQLGSADGQPGLEPGGAVYVQNDPAKAGFNPNDEHAFITASNTGSGQAIFALRSDFGTGLRNENGVAVDLLAASEPYVLYRYFDTALQERRFHVYRVTATDATYPSFAFPGVAGTPVAPPYPVRLMANCAETRIVGEVAGLPPPLPFFRDYKNQLWARSAGQGKALYFYPVRPDFFTDRDNNGINDLTPGQCVAWLARLPVADGGYGTPDEPIEVTYDIDWPATTPLLTAGETLLVPKRGLPDIVNQAAVEVVYDDLQDGAGSPRPPAQTLAQVIAPLEPRWVSLKQLPTSLATGSAGGGMVAISGSADGTLKLSTSLGQRLLYDPLNKRLGLQGIYDPAFSAGDPLVLLNVLSKRDLQDLIAIDTSGAYSPPVPPAQPRECVPQSPGVPSTCSWGEAVHALFRLSRNPNDIGRICTQPAVAGGVASCDEDDKRDVNDDDVLVGFQDANGDTILEPYRALGSGNALSAGASQGNGYMTVAFNNDPSLTPAPVSLSVIQVGCLTQGATVLGPYQGQIHVVAPDNIFDEQLTLRHSGDFGGNPDLLDFEWYYAPPNDSNGLGPSVLPPAPAWELLNPEAAQQRGRNEISIFGADVKTLSDGYFFVRYKGLPQCQNAAPTFGDASYRGLFAGDPAGTPTTPRPQLGEGWVKRVLARLNPFEQRVQDFASTAINTFTSMLVQLGARYEGPVALNSDPDNLNAMGLIEAYTTVMRRAMDLSVNTGLNYDPANNAILLVASRIADFYTLLGNEAFADAEDPTIAVGSSANDTFSLPPSVFAFQNQLDSLLSEELVLLRGRDDLTGGVAARPIYNRLVWNFTRGDGEVAYANSYNITDQNADGLLDERDGRILYPQGHGDAWGHYLTAAKTYYELLRHPNFTWNPRAESVLVAGTVVPVDYQDERQFAEIAAAKARAGAQIVDLTYRARYVEAPEGQFQGYEDTNRQRAWGLSEWGKRAGQGAYFDWVLVNAIVPAEDPDPTHEGIQKIERRTIYELDEIAGHFDAIQGQVDKADAGLNPLGLAKGVVPFDIDPAQLDRFNKTQFEQVYDRALVALRNVHRVWDFANQLNNQLRRSQLTADGLYDLTVDQETDFANELIGIFGYPYADDIGAGKTYPAGYDGPDLYHYNYVDVPELAGTALEGAFGDSQRIGRFGSIAGTFLESPNGIGHFNVGPVEDIRNRTGSNGQKCSQEPFAPGCALGDRDHSNFITVDYTTFESPDTGAWFSKPPEWSGQRRAPGRLQQTIQQMLAARIAVKQAQLEYDKLRQDIEAQGRLVQATFNTSEANVGIAQEAKGGIIALSTLIASMRTVSDGVDMSANMTDDMFEDGGKCIPDNTIIGLAAGGNLLAPLNCALQATGTAIAFGLRIAQFGAQTAANFSEIGKEDIALKAEIDTRINEAALEIYGLKGELDAMVREEPVLRAEIYARIESLRQLVGDYYATLADGQRAIDRLVVFRRNSAAEVQGQRYRDMAFRIFRNDALAKYRQSFDLAARYAYLAATAYDYETNLGGADAKAGQAFLTQIVRERSIGQVIGGEPQPGSPGLADSLSRLKANFDVLKGQMGFNNPQNETNRFSLRRELFRIPDGPEGDAAWREKLKSLRVDNLWNVPEFRRYARPFAPESSGPQPGLVITFDTDVTFGLNYFGWELGPQDSSYDSSQFATRIRSVGAWFKDYAGLPLADDPRIYLFPVGADVLRAPNADNFATREWQVVDQAIPVPFPIGNTQLANFAWNPLQSLSGSSTELRRYARFRAYNYAEPFDEAEVTADSRLIGRSVWNRKWMMIIPGGTFLNDASAGLDTFVDGRVVPGSTQRDGDGVDDIYIFFKTYAYSGQ